MVTEGFSPIFLFGDTFLLSRPHTSNRKTCTYDLLQLRVNIIIGITIAVGKLGKINFFYNANLFSFSAHAVCKQFRTCVYAAIHPILVRSRMLNVQFCVHNAMFTCVLPPKVFFGFLLVKNY